MKKFKKLFTLMLAFVIAVQFTAMGDLTAMAYNAGDVVINEVAWAATQDSSTDEWIELYNTTNSAIDLSGWKIVDDGSSDYTITTGSIQPHGYFLIEDAEQATNAPADALIGLSLANAGDSLVLKNNSGMVIDTVNGSGGAWYAGNATTKATMERIDPSVLTDSAANWANAASSNGATGRSGGAILGTPKSANSNYGGGGAEVSIAPAEATANDGDRITFSVNANGATDLYAYGFEINYNPAVLNYVSAAEGSFLKLDGAATAFNAALQNGVQGALIVGNARMLNPPSGVDGSGKLFDMVFDVIGDDGESSVINFAASSYLADVSGSVSAQFRPANVNVGGVQNVDPAENFAVSAGTERYTLKLSWNAGVSGADTYIIKKRATNGSYVLLGTTAETFYLDNNSLVPGIAYNYQITAVKGGVESTAVTASGTENRGIKGDLDRSDRVDGKDVEKLARSFGSGYGDEEYNALNDLNYDGIIDGSDLIDIGINFGVTYQ